MTSFHVFTLITPFGRVTYAHHALDRLNDGAEGFITDATLDREDGSEPTPLALDEVVGYIRRFGPAAVVRPPERIESKRLA